MERLITWKKRLLYLFFLPVFFSCITGKTSQISYPLDVEVDEKVAEYKKNGWQLHGSSHTLKGVLRLTLQRLYDTPGLQEITGTANNFTVVSLGKEAAASNAGNRYAAAATRLVEGEISTVSELDQLSSEEKEQMKAAYSTQLQRLIRGELKEAYTLLRIRPDGRYDCEIHYLVEETEAFKSREQALQKALGALQLSPDVLQKLYESIQQTPSW